MLLPVEEETSSTTSPCGSSSDYAQCPVNWVNDKYMAAVFERIVARGKMDHIMKLSDFLSDSKNKPALYRFMASNQTVVPKHLQYSEVLTTAKDIQFHERSARGLAVGFSSRCSTYRLISPP